MNLLKTRLKKNLSKEEIATFKDAVRLFPTNRLVDEYNRKKIYKKCKNVISIPVCHDDDLLIAVGAPVLLTHNLSVEMGLVNGSQGVVKDILYLNTKNKIVDCILVDFPSYIGPKVITTSHGSGFPIFKITVPHKIKIDGVYPNVCRFPLVLSYSLTTHKCQSLTLEKIVVKLGKQEIFSALDYVGLSRVKSISDVLIMDKDISIDRFKQKGKSIIARIEEENRLKSTNQVYKLFTQAVNKSARSV